jgi:tRNA (cmo5U34)-methyltransferase
MIGELVPPSVFKTAAGRTPSWVGSIPILPRQARSYQSARDPHIEAWHDRESIDSWLAKGDARAPLLQWASTLLPFPADSALNVLDVGAGDGAFARHVLGAYPRSTLCLEDFSEAMAAEAAQRLASFSGRVCYHMSDLRDPGWADGLHGPFDVVISSYVIHGLPEPALIPRLYKEFCRLICPGGSFLNVDLILYPPESSVMAGIYRTADPAQPTHPDDEDDDVAAEPVTLQDHLRWLRDAGFAEADCVWKNLRGAVLWAVRAA